MAQRRIPAPARPGGRSGVGGLLEGWADDLGSGEPTETLAQTARRWGIDLVRRYHRQRIEVRAPLPPEPVLFVGNHGFGGVLDLNVFALLSALDRCRPDRPATILAHQMAWTFGLGALLEAIGARPASQENAMEAFSEGRDVVVFPGGDVDAAKSWRNRNTVVFSGRSGFARLAMRADVPMVPVVTVGAGESLFVLSDGHRLAQVLGLHRLLRVRVLPISLSVPWGLGVGVVGVGVPYLPLPSRLETAVLPAMRPQAGETAEEQAGRVQSRMQEAVDELVHGRRWLLGRPSGSGRN